MCPFHALLTAGAEPRVCGARACVWLQAGAQGGVGVRGCALLQRSGCVWEKKRRSGRAEHTYTRAHVYERVLCMRV
jgi:hypothetical protein